MEAERVNTSLEYVNLIHNLPKFEFHKMLNLEVQNLSSLPCNGYFEILRVMVSRDVVPWGSGVLLLVC